MSIIPKGRDIRTLEELKATTADKVIFFYSDKNLTAIPKEVFEQADKITLLDLRNNQITELPSEIAQLSNLEFLILNNNLLQEIEWHFTRRGKFSQVEIHRHIIFVRDEQ